MDVNTLAIVVLLGSFALMILLRFPIAYAVGLSSVFCLMSMGNSLNAVCRLMVKGISSFSLMAVPFFITMGVLMGKGGISDKLIALANACVGWMRGGLAMVNIVASYFFGGISGSASADTASIGSIMIPMMVDQGYDADFSTAVTITSSCEGLLVPPSHNMVIYATTAGGISVGSLFLAGYLPGALLALSLMVGSYIISVKRNYPKGERFHIGNFLKQLWISIWALQADMKIPAGLIPHCPVCGKPMTMNLRADDTFVQDKGWYQAGERYSDFIRRHKGLPVLFLELGVGMNTPGIIKYPFWRMTAANPRAVYACVNHGEAVCPQEIEGQSVCIDGDIGEVLNRL